MCSACQDDAASTACDRGGGPAWGGGGVRQTHVRGRGGQGDQGSLPHGRVRHPLS